MFLLHVLRVVCYAAGQVLLFIETILEYDTVLYETYRDISSGCFIEFPPHLPRKLTVAGLKEPLRTPPRGLF